MRAPIVLLLSLSFPSSALAQAAARPTTAVFEVELDARAITGVSAHALSEDLVAAVQGNGDRVLPRATVERQIEKRKKESRRCDQPCRVEVARELAARKAIFARVGAGRGSCQTKLELIDVSRGTVERSASGNGACTQDGIAQALRAGLEQLTTGGGSAPASSDTPEGVVRAFMELTLENWRADKANDNAAVKDTERRRLMMLSPSKLRASGKSVDQMEVNDYAFEEYAVLEVNGDTITVRGFNRTNGWSRTMWFKTQVEEGRRVIVPSRVAEYVDAWSRLDESH